MDLLSKCKMTMAKNEQINWKSMKLNYAFVVENRLNDRKVNFHD